MIVSPISGHLSPTVCVRSSDNPYVNRMKAAVNTAFKVIETNNLKKREILFFTLFLELDASRFEPKDGEALFHQSKKNR